MRILQVSAELFPLLKTGGLADIAGALPVALGQAGVQVRVLLPGFSAIRDGLADTVTVGHFQTPWGDAIRVDKGVVDALSGPGAPVWAYVIVAPALYERPGGPYEDAQRKPFADNHRRFATLGWAAAHLAHGLDREWSPDIVHCHDWHAALAPACLAFWPDPRAPRIPSVFTVHNLAYQGLFEARCFGDLGLPPQAFHINGVEFHGQVSFMKAGLFYSSFITTVSPTYAREIQTPEQGCGLDGLLRGRQAQLLGILNAVDETVWNPATDTLIDSHFDATRMDGKARCKAALQAELGLAALADAALFTVVSRLTEQKGLPLVLAGVADIVQRGGQLLVLGSGDTALEQAFAQQAVTHKGSVALRLGYDEALAHRIFAGSDVTLVPSRFEPCGLTQMYALKYGSLPLVRRVGGLADTVVDTDLATLDDGSATGLVFNDFSETDYRHALTRTFALYKRRSDWKHVQKTGMQVSFDWRQAAVRYLGLYQGLLGL